MSDWRPIETAPKDGTKVDLWLQIQASAVSFRVTDAWWQESANCWGCLFPGQKPAHLLNTDYVTHWMPIHPGPKD
jgi:hypothetical protein